MIEENIHHIVVSQLEGSGLDEALVAIKQLPDAYFDRYDNPFEQKLALREKSDLPQDLERLVSQLERLILPSMRLFNVKLSLDAQRHYMGVFKYLNGDKLDIHVDAGIHPATGMRKHVTAVLYLGEGGGPLEFWHGESCVGESQKLKSIITQVNPSHGKLVLFENNDHAWHGTPVYRGTEPRIVVTVSYLSKHIARFGNRRQRAFFVPRPYEKWTDETYALRDTRADSKKFAEAYRSMS